MTRYTIRTRLRELADRHDPPLTIAQIAAATGLTDNTVRRYYNNDVITRYEREVILELIRLFGLKSLDDLLELQIEE